MTDYLAKDKAKFSVCSHIFGYGSDRSSSRKYITNPKQWLGLDLNIDWTTVDEQSIVGLTAEGNRRGRAEFPYALMKHLIKRKPVFVTDNAYDANRSYNVGEREVADYLLKNDYVPEYSDLRTIWKPK